MSRIPDDLLSRTFPVVFRIPDDEGDFNPISSHFSHSI